MADVTELLASHPGAAPRPVPAKHECGLQLYIVGEAERRRYSGVVFNERHPGKWSAIASRKNHGALYGPYDREIDAAAAFARHKNGGSLSSQLPQDLPGEISWCPARTVGPRVTTHNFLDVEGPPTELSEHPS